jgi:hypothetical protein
VAVLIALTAMAVDPLAGFHRAWAVQLGVAIVAACVLVAFAESRNSKETR